MPGTDEGRRYDERQVALILRKAAELQVHDPVGPPRAGLSLPEIETIAREVGIDAAYVRRAADGVAGGTRSKSLTGGPLRLQAQRVVEGEADADALARVADAARAEFGRHGTVRDALGGMEWRGKDSFGSATVSVRSARGSTRVFVEADRSEAAVSLGIILPIAGIVAGGIATTILPGVPDAMLAVAGGLGGLGTARVLWGRVARRWGERVNRVAAELASAARTEAHAADDSPA